MDIVKIVKAKIETRIKEWEDLKKRILNYKTRRCGDPGYSEPMQLWIKVEELEEEIEKLKEVLKMAKCKVCESQEDLIKVKDEEGNIVYVCENCYKSLCEGYEKIEDEGYGCVC